MDYEVRDRLVLLKRKLNQNKTAIQPPKGLFGATIGALSKALGGRENRIEFLKWAFDEPEITSSNKLKPWQQKALVDWAMPAKFSDNSPWTFDHNFFEDCRVVKENIQ